MPERAREQLEAFTEKLGEIDGPSAEGYRWNGTLAQLAYLLHQLRKAGLLGEVNLWAMAERVFVKQDGSPIERTSMKSIAHKYGLNDGERIPGADDIDRVLESLVDGLPPPEK